MSADVSETLALTTSSETKRYIPKGSSNRVRYVTRTDAFGFVSEALNTAPSVGPSSRQYLVELFGLLDGVFHSEKVQKTNYLKLSGYSAQILSESKTFLRHNCNADG